MNPSEIRKQVFQEMLEYRGVETVCRDCSGLGVKTYPDTSTWMRRTSGQTITADICDRCWGSGDSDKPWISLKEVLALRKKVTQLEEKLNEDYNNGLRK